MPPLLALVWLIACAEGTSSKLDDGPEGTSGSAGASGQAGSSGQAGAGQGGSAGSSAGQGGEGGSAGTGGSGGAGQGGSGAGQGGSAGSSAGQGGEGGEGGGGQGGAGAGQGGEAGSGGSAGGEPFGGSGGKAGSGGESGQGGGSGSGGSGGCKAVVINEVSTGGLSNGNDDFIELYNPGGCEADVGGWKVLYRPFDSTGGSTVITFWEAPSSQKLGPGAFFVLGTKEFGGDVDETLSSGMKQEGGGIALSDGSGAIVDSIAWGTAVAKHPFIEGTKCDEIPLGKSASRKPDGGDTDDNAADFVVPSERTPGAKNF